MIDLGNSDFKLILEGTIPSGNPNAKICIDNITSSVEKCKIPISEDILNAPRYYSWVSLMGKTFATAFLLGLTIPIIIFLVCLFVRKRQYISENIRINRHTDQFDSREAISTFNRDTNSMSPVGQQKNLNRAMSSQIGTNNQGGNYITGKRNQTPQQTMGLRNNNRQINRTSSSRMENGWMVSSPQNDEYTIDMVYTTHPQISGQCSQAVANVNQNNMSSMSAVNKIGSPSANHRSTPFVQSQASVCSVTTSLNNPFNNLANNGISEFCQDNRSVAGSRIVLFSDENRAAQGLPFYPPRYEEAIGFNRNQHMPMEEKPPILPPRVPENCGSGATASSSVSGLPSPSPLPLSFTPFNN